MSLDDTYAGTFQQQIDARNAQIKMEHEMSENKFWITIWAMGFVTFCFLIACVSFVNYSDTQTVERLVKAGADPFAARCAVAPDTQRGICAMYSSIKVQE